MGQHETTKYLRILSILIVPTRTPSIGNLHPCSGPAGIHKEPENFKHISHASINNQVLGICTLKSLKCFENFKHISRANERQLSIENLHLCCGPMESTVRLGIYTCKLGPQESIKFCCGPCGFGKMNTTLYLGGEHE